MSRPAILCVDDERTVLVSLKEQLRRRFGKSHVVETAESGEAALVLLDELRAEGVVVPVVVSDQIMPGMKGDELLERIENRAPETIKIMLTGQASADAVGSAVNRANLFRYLSKPWAESDLALTVKSAIDAFDGKERLRLHQATLQELNELALELTASLGARDRYARLVSRVSRVLGVHRVALFGARGSALVRLATVGPDAEDVPRVLMPAPEGPLARALASESIARCPTTSGACALGDEVGWGRATGGVIAVALRAARELTGVLVLATDEPLDQLGDDRIRGFGALTAASLRTAGLIDAIELASERQRQVAGVLLRQADSRSAGPMHGQSAAIHATLASLARVAEDDTPYLLVGAPGTGHEAAARHVHRLGRRADGPFLTISAAAIQRPDVLGTSDPASMPWLAHGGTLYIVGVDRLTTAAQVELVHTLGRLGGAEMPSVRLALSTTATDEMTLRSAVEPRLLEQLRARVVLPPLRERVEDIPTLAQFYLRAHATRLGRVVDQFPEGADSMLARYPWPGNVEELDRVIERAVLTAKGRVAAIERGLFDGAQTIGSYRLLERIGAGGMGEVWKAQHEHLRRPAAVKLILSSATRDAHEQASQRFRREAGATASLRSPHTVELYDFGINEQGDLYYVMELLDGVNLQTLVKEHGALPAERVVHLLVQACHSLMEAHEAGLVHRDIKPANLFTCRYGPDHDFLKVLDFGMVTATAGDDQTSLTQPGAIPGTPTTLAPEALREAIDHRSDLYALGCTAYYLLTGRNVFLSRVPAILLDHLSTPPEPPSAVTQNPIPAELEALVLALLAKDPSERPQSARELRERLSRLELREAWTQERAAAWWATHDPMPPPVPAHPPTYQVSAHARNGTTR